jgi:transposase
MTEQEALDLIVQASGRGPLGTGDGVGLTVQGMNLAWFEVRLADPGQAAALKGRRRRAKTDRLDARWMVLLLAKEMLPQAWLAPEDIQRLRDQTRLRQALRHDRTRWAQRLHAVLAHEGVACSRSRLLKPAGRSWLDALELTEEVRDQVNCHLRLIDTIEGEMKRIEHDLRQFARTDARAVALQGIYGVGVIIACHLLAEIGDAKRFRRSRQIIRVAGLDPVVMESAEQRRRGRLSKSGSPQLRWALVQAAQQTARRPSSPDRTLYLSARARAGSQRATLTCARKIARRAYHVLAAVEIAA